MKKGLKIFGALLLLILVLASVFFFWASSPTLESDEYQKMITYNYPQDIDNDSIFSVITYNIGYLSGMTNNRAVAKPKSLFDKNLESVITETKKLKPDIIAFQEIDYDAARSYHINQEEEIAKLGYSYAARAINWDETYVPFPYWPPKMHFGKVVSGQSIISKYPLKYHKRIVLERVADAPFYRDALYLERLAQVVKVTLQQKEIVIINVHLEAFDKSTRQKQFKEVLQFFNQYKKDYPVILLGDFNSKATDKSAAIQELLTMDELGNAAFVKENPSPTFDSKKPYKRIDYIFFTKNSIELVSGKVLQQFGEASDHLPVYMEFRLK